MNNYFRRRRAASLGAGSEDPIGDALRADVKAYWTMNEASGTRADATGRGNDLSAINAPVSAAGKVGNAVTFDGTDEALRRASTADLVVSGTIYGSFWLKLHSTEVFQGIVSKSDGLGEVFDYEVVYRSFSDTMRLYFVYNLDLDSVSVDTAAGILDDTWYFLEWYITSGEIGIALNGGSFSTASTAEVPLTTDSFFWVGNDQGSNPADADIDEMLILHRLPTSNERAYLYNSGSGRTLYP